MIHNRKMVNAMLNKIRFIILFIGIFSVSTICFAGNLDQKGQLNTNPKTIFNAFFRMNSIDSQSLPSPPILTKFDERVLSLCGDWGNKPTKDEFIAMLTEPEFRDVANAIYDALEHTVITLDADIDTFITELANIWFNEKGFAHIFCGEPRSRTLAGMHYAPRVQQAQQNKWAGLVGYETLPTDSSMYKLDIKYLDPKGKIRVKPYETFDKELHADDILIYATLAFKMTQEENKEVDYALNGYIGRFVKRNNAILTFFPKLINLPLTPDVTDAPDSPDVYYSLPEVESDGAVKEYELPGDDFYEKLEKLN